MSSESTLAAFRLPTTMLDDLKVYCEENDLNQSQVIRKALKNFIYENDKVKDKSNPYLYGLGDNV